MLDRLLTNEGPEVVDHLPREARVEIARAPALASHREELIRAARFQQVMTEIEQRKLKAVSDLLEQRHIEGIGQRIAVIHPRYYVQMEAQYGQGCWRDKEFMADTLKRNPHFRVRCAPAKTTLLVNGMRESGNQGSAGRAGASTKDCHRRETAAAGAPLVSAPSSPARPLRRPGLMLNVEKSGRLESSEGSAPSTPAAPLRRSGLVLDVKGDGR